MSSDDEPPWGGPRRRGGPPAMVRTFVRLAALLPVFATVLAHPSGAPVAVSDLWARELSADDQDLYLSLRNQEEISKETENRFPNPEQAILSRSSRAIDDDDEDKKDGVAAEKPRIMTVRLSSTSKDVTYGDNGNIHALKGKEVRLKLYGMGLTNDTLVKLTTAKAESGGSCKTDSRHYIQTEAFSMIASPGGMSATMVIPGGKIPLVKDQKVFYFCLKESGGFVHQGTDGDAQIELYELLLPIWLMIIFIVVLLCLSGLFSGLNLGLMALDQTELKIVQNTGTDKEKSYANKIAPIRAHGNFLLCSLLLGNVLVNNTLTILLDTLTSGLVAVVGATMGIVVFGEIIPQAICSRHGLAVGAYTIWMTKFFMLLTFPLSFPISKLLDKLLGAEIGTVYDKKKLIELLRVTNEDNDLEKEEVDIVTGALVYKDKTVRDVMTKVDDVYMLPLEAVLDFDTVSDIREQGYSRIPVYSNERKNIVHILFAKDLMFVDPDDKMPVNMVCEFYSNDVNFVFHDTPLNVMFNEFKGGDKGHMAFVQEINSIGDGDPFYETIGLVTLEDIIEEIIQQEIVDETDVITDNRTKKRRKREGRQGKEGNFQLLNPEEKKRITISPQLTLALFQYLTTSIEPFKAPAVNDSVLKKLLTLDVFREIKLKKDMTKMNEEDLIIISKAKPIDFFILIIEGRVEVNIGREELVFESGPFTYFGIQTLNNVMIETPPSPVPGSSSSGLVGSVVGQVAKAVTTPSSLVSSGSQGESVSQAPGGPRGSLRKASTQNAFELQPSSAFTSKRNSVAIGDNSPAVKNTPFVPDYTVKAVSDVLYLKVKKSTYSAALKASKINRKQATPGDMRDIDHFLEKVNEDEDTGDLVLMRTPSVKSIEPSQANTASTASPAMMKRIDSPVKPPPNPTDGAKPESEFWGEERKKSMDQGAIVADLVTSAASAGANRMASNNGPVNLSSNASIRSVHNNHSSNNNSAENNRTSLVLDAEGGDAAAVKEDNATDNTTAS